MTGEQHPHSGVDLHPIGNDARLRRHELIAQGLSRAISNGLFPPGSTLPSESELADTYGASRGTVRRALLTLAANGLIATRQGARRVVLDSPFPQTFSELKSFAEWASGIGRAPGGHFVTRRIDKAGTTAAEALQIALDAPLLYTVRLRLLDGRPIFVERCWYPEWLIQAVLELDADCPSVTLALRESRGLVLASGSHLIDVVDADAEDVELLGVAAGDPVLRRRGVTRRPDGTPCDYTDDHYVKGSVTFGIQNSVSSNLLSRQFAGD
ncbi:GntR family transcriptional regulator [Nakamurella panacisegetis]|uniref:GntR family transcriptional regulator n=1 Tax=Nakamurella panacisegetis TaxID=1090615 RepID=A0A1H0S306_9ACTN|nr:GntR family transcriptional regulator [Nakamurella panacisegetis]SDP35969.1 GntR family transcriptional regulator [Nakamurella panacisegetis]